MEKEPNTKPKAEAPEPNKAQPAQTQVAPETQMSQENQKLVKKVTNKNKNWIFPVIALVVVLSGIGTGYMLSGANAKTTKTTNKTTTETVNENNTLAAETGEAVEDEEAPIGTLVEGGEGGEGTHTLERGLGPEKDVYLLSTVLTLDNFVGKKVQVWGEDLGAKEVGWLMDVTKVRVLE